MAVQGNTGNGATLVGSVTTTAFHIVSINPGSQSVEMLETSDLNSTDYKEYIAGDLKETNEMTATVRWDSTHALPPIGGTAQTWTLTFPTAIGAATTVTASTLVGTGFVTSIEFPELANDTVQEGTFTYKFDGDTGPTYTAEA